ncbi:MAG: metallophosphoesterase [Paraglaciecola sp.]|uniref:metallophosphoesterase n=1 Tax=Paraglaciecola sp. TaxID=1920173 RepID=UPI003296DF6F
MYRVLKTNLKHSFLTLSILLLLIASFGIYHGAEAHFNENPLAYKLDKEGPHIFFEGNQLSVNVIRGGKPEGFYNDKTIYPLQSDISAKAFFTLEQQEFEFAVSTEINTPASVYSDNNPILAISDIESGYKAFRDFLIINGVIDKSLDWTFGKGHLVLVGDLIDRGNSVTQVLWFIYKLEQDARQHGGHVHFIIGNHEIKNMQSNFYSASEKYLYVAAIIGKTQADLYSDSSFLGRWMASKNTLERINGNLFVHGGIHPKLSEFDYSLEEINHIVRNHYRKPYFTKRDSGNAEFLVSSKTGPSWYRGYFKDDLSQSDIEKGLDKFAAQAVIVGHTLQWSVKKLYQGKVYAIDVKHPNDYESNFPPRSSEGLLIEAGNYYRVLSDGSKQLL